MAETAQPDFHIGRLIRAELDRQKRPVTWLAERINCDHTNCYLIFDKQYIDVPLLCRISKALDHNFFNELAAYMERVVKLSTDV